MELAEKAVAARPNAGGMWNTLGVALYRDGQWEASVAALDKSLELRGGCEGCAFLFLAMANRRAGDATAARHRFEQAVAWLETRPGNNPGHGATRAEAEELLKPEFGKD